MKTQLSKLLALVLLLGAILPQIPFTSPQIASAATNLKALAHYHFDGTPLEAGEADHPDLSGTLVGGMASDSEGEVGSAAKFNGTDGYLTLPSTLAAADAFTFSAWVKWDGKHAWSRIFDIGGPNHFMYLTPQGVDGKMTFSIYEGADQMLIGGEMPVDEWVNVAVAIGGGSGTLYLNGEAVATNPAMTFKPSELAADYFYLGKSRFAADALIGGSMDEVQIWHQSLTQRELADAIAAQSAFYPAAPYTSAPLNVDDSIVDDESKWGTSNTHDGDIIQVDGMYYVFSTDYKVGGTAVPGIQIRKSPDLIHWTFVGRVFDKVSDDALAWVNGNAATTTFWAPEAVEMDGRYYLYYSVSQIGTRNSYIGLATSDAIEGPWADEGAVFKTKDGDSHTVNAIDPNIVFDADGQPWMSYGSYFGGIFMSQIDASTGLLQTADDEGTLIAKRRADGLTATGPGIEGPNAIYNASTGYYYLSVSYGWLEDTYNVRIGRSHNVTGPYVDYNGQALIDPSGTADTGTKIVSSYAFQGDKGWLGTGHDAFLQDGDDTYLIHNGRSGENKYWSHLHVRKVLWTADGWPVVSPERYAGEEERQMTVGLLAGEWEQLVLDRTDDTQRKSTTLHLLPDGKINDQASSNYWTLTGANTVTLHWYAPGVAPGDYWVDTLLALPSWDWETWKPTIVFTGLNQAGTAIWGKKVTVLTDEASVAAAKVSLSLTAGIVKDNLTLPIAGDRGTSIVWTSDKPDVIAPNGTVQRPAAGSGDALVTLTARITKGDASDTKAFSLTVKQSGTELAAAYTFNSSSVPYADSTDNKLNAAPNGDVSWAAEGKYGGAAVLGGKDGYLTVSNALTDAKDFTFSGWVKWEGGNHWQRIFDFGGSGGFMFLTPSNADGKLMFTIYKDSTDQQLFGDTFPVNTWTHVAVTLAGDTGKLYVNGKLKDTNTHLTFNPDDLIADSNYLGKSRFAGDPALSGALDEISFWRKALSQAEIQAQMNTDTSGGGGDTGGSGNGNTGNVGSAGGSTAPATAGRVTLDSAKLQATADGNAVVVLPSDANEAAIPVSLISGLKINKLTIRKDGIMLELPMALLQRLAGLSVSGQIVLAIDTVVNSSSLLKQAGMQSGAIVQAAGGIYSFHLGMETAGNYEAVTAFTEGITLHLKADEASDTASSLRNVYAIAADGKLTYVPGVLTGGEWLVPVTHFSEYGVLSVDKTFMDVPAAYWASAAIKSLAAKQIAKGMTDGSFAPGKPVTRAEFAAFLARTLNLEAKGTASFTDVKSTAWYAASAAALQEAGLLNGQDGNRLAPDAKITREEAAVLLVRAYTYRKGGGAAAGSAEGKFKDASAVSAWAAEAVGSAASLGLITGRGDHTFAPKAELTRAESMQLLLNLLAQS